MVQLHHEEAAAGRRAVELAQHLQDAPQAGGGVDEHEAIAGSDSPIPESGRWKRAEAAPPITWRHHRSIPSCDVPNRPPSAPYVLTVLIGRGFLETWRRTHWKLSQ